MFGSLIPNLQESNNQAFFCVFTTLGCRWNSFTDVLKQLPPRLAVLFTVQACHQTRHSRLANASQLREVCLRDTFL